MTLTILGSGSSGNGYVIQNDQEALILETGMPVQDCLKALNYNVRKVKGCLVTHEHGDHAKYAKDYLRYFPITASAGTIKAIKTDGAFFKPQPIKQMDMVRYGGFTITAIPASHDANEPLAYVIDHDEIGRLLFATDTTIMEYTIPGMTQMMIECNYDIRMLDANVKSGVIEPFLAERTVNSHMSLTTLKEMLDANDLSNVWQIILIHVSARNGAKEAFCREIASKTGKPTIAARKGLTIEINKEPI